MKVDYRADTIQQAPQRPWLITGDALHDQSILMLGGVVYMKADDIDDDRNEDLSFRMIAPIFGVLVRS